ncbi:hypothetical protein NC652_009007 [Populus alba x Populus x berolinensis]|nr:hypothetical protein NC652_009007 [Populus alba x Populus x berolinensis]
MSGCTFLIKFRFHVSDGTEERKVSRIESLYCRKVQNSFLRKGHGLLGRGLETVCHCVRVRECTAMTAPFSHHHTVQWSNLSSLPSISKIIRCVPAKHQELATSQPALRRIDEIRTKKNERQQPSTISPSSPHYGERPSNELSSGC